MKLFQRLAVVLTAVLTALLLGLPIASASEPVDLSGAYAYDEVGVLDDIAAIEEANKELFQDKGYHLFAVFVSDFENPSDAALWAEEVAEISNMGVNDLIIAVAVDSRNYELSIDPRIDLTDAQLDRIEDAIVRELANDNWQQAVLAGIDAFSSKGGGAGLVGSGGGPSFEGIVKVAGFAIIVFFILRSFRARKSGGGSGTGATAAPAPDPAKLAELRKEASHALLTVDEAILESKQELGFAEAQFGSEVTRQFQEVLDGAEKQVLEAFELQQKLDDGIEDTPQEIFEWTNSIIAKCQQAEQDLESQTERFQQLRNLRDRAPEALAELKSKLAQVQENWQQAVTTLQTMMINYDQDLLASYADAPQRGQGLLADVRAAIQKGETALASSDTSQAIAQVHMGEQALSLVQNAIVSINSRRTEFTKNQDLLRDALLDAKADLQAVSQLPADQAQVHAAANKLRTIVSQIETAGKSRRPAVDLQRLTQADQQLDVALSASRTEQENQKRAKQNLDRLLESTRIQLESGESVLRQGGRGLSTQARTRIVEARRYYDQAVAVRDTDLVAAATHAQRAQSLITQSAQNAYNDYGYTRQPTSGGGIDWGSLMMGVLLGRNTGSSGGYSSGGRSYRSSGWGGSSYRGSSWGGSSSRGSSRSSYSSSRSSSSRSSGGRSRGGRF